MNQEQHQAIGDVIDAVKRLLSRFACATHAPERADETGVAVQFNTVRRNMIRFVFTTEDKITVRIKFDLNELSREYINGMVIGVLDHLEEKRKERAGSIIVVSPPSPKAIAVAMAGHA